MGLSTYDILGPRTTTLITHAARRTAWRHGLRAADHADLRQEMCVAVIQRAHRFDPARGAITTFVRTVTERQAHDLMDHRFAARRDPRRSVPLDTALNVMTDSRAHERAELRLDVGVALSTLLPATRRVAEHLMSDSALGVARTLGLTRGQVRHQITLLRQRFTLVGLAPEGRAVA